jgi:hypothetical protein
MPDDLLYHLARLATDDGEGGPSAAAIADVLWMARYLQPTSPPESPLPPDLAFAPPSEPLETLGAGRPRRTAPAAPEPRKVDLHPLSPSGGKAGSGGPAAAVRVPAVTALPNKLEVSRSLRPLNRRVPARGRLCLAEDSTAAAFGETRMILPIWRPATERWLQIDLVADTSASMTIWQQTVAEFRSLIEYLGAFRDVRTWAINGDELRPRMTAFANPQASQPAVPHSPAEFLDPGGRRAVLVITDAVGAAWHTGAMTKFLATWAHSCPLAIVQVLPRRLWHRTALNAVKTRMTHSDHPPFCAVRTDRARADTEGDHQRDGWVPILHPSGEWLQPWAAMVAGAGEVMTDIFAMPLSLETPLSADRIPTARETPSDSDARRKYLRRFLDREASPQAAELAGYLAAAPLTLPIMRLVQRSMLPRSGPEHLAEVFLSGLLVRGDPVADGTDPDAVVYEFRDDFREQLLGGLTRRESLRVLEVLSGVSGIVAERFGGLLDFRALASLATAGPRSLPPASLPFARIAAAVLRGLGGAYTELATTLTEQADADSRASVVGNGGAAAHTTRASAESLVRGGPHAGRAPGGSRQASGEGAVTKSTYAQQPTDTLSKALADGVAALDEHDALTIAELTTAGIVVWEARRNMTGTPRCRHWPAVPWSSVYNDDGILAEDALRRVIRAGSGARMVFVCSSLDGPYATDALGWLRYAYPAAPAFQCTAPLDDLLRRAIADVPLTQRYELVVLRRARSGELVLTGCQLFSPGAQRGDRRSFTIRCEPSDENGTVFAVVTAEPEYRFQLVSLQSAKLTPDRYHLTAELRRPGLVRFHGLPAGLRTDYRSWPELVAAVPERLDPAEPAHLICVVEVSGASDQALERLERIGQLVGCAADDAKDRLAVSLISYGPHSVDRGGPEVPLKVWTWADSSDAALSALGQLRDRGPAELGYPRAAQLECVLTEVADRLTGREGRPFLVAVGSRPAFPKRVDPASEIIPCPRGRDWRRALHRLREHPGIAFGAIHDHGMEEEIWSQLSHDASTRVDAVDMQGFAADLGLLSLTVELGLRSLTVQPVPFPLVDVAEG